MTLDDIRRSFGPPAMDTQFAIPAELYNSLERILEHNARKRREYKKLRMRPRDQRSWKGESHLRSHIGWHLELVERWLDKERERATRGGYYVPRKRYDLGVPVDAFIGEVVASSVRFVAYCKRLLAAFKKWRNPAPAVREDDARAWVEQVPF